MGGSRVRIHWRLPSRADAPRQARGLLESARDLASHPDVVFAARLITHELVANSVRHANLSPAKPIQLVLEFDDDVLFVDVSHPDEGFDALAALATHYRQAEPHHGLFLLDTLADRWGFRRGGSRSGVSFELDLMTGRRTWNGREPTRTTEPPPPRASLGRPGL